MNKTLYTFLQWTWGLPQTLAGAVLYTLHRKDKHFDYMGARATAWDLDRGVSLGRYIFVPELKTAGIAEEPKPSAAKSIAKDIRKYTDLETGTQVSHFLLTHEYGHTIQSLILGPSYLLLVGLPSIIWNRLPYFARMREQNGKSYYSAVFESTANHLGSRSDP